MTHNDAISGLLDAVPKGWKLVCSDGLYYRISSPGQLEVRVERKDGNLFAAYGFERGSVTPEQLRVSLRRFLEDLPTMVES